MDTNAFLHVELSAGQSTAEARLVILPTEIYEPKHLLHKPVLFRIMNSSGEPASGVGLEVTWSSGTVLDNVRGQTSEDGAAALALVSAGGWFIARLKGPSAWIYAVIVDEDERSCGIVDDVELSGGPGKETRVKALLVGPGAYRGRMPRWMFWFVRKIAGDRMVRVPASQIIEIGAVVKLGCRGEKLGLHEAEDRASAWIPKWGAL